MAIIHSCEMQQNQLEWRELVIDWHCIVQIYTMRLVRVLINFCGCVLTHVKNNKTRVMILSALAVIVIKLLNPRKTPVPYISISQFLQWIHSGKVKEAIIRPHYIIFKNDLQRLWKTNHSLMPRGILFDRLEKAKVNFSFVTGGGGQGQLYLLFFMSLAATLAFFYFNSKQDESHRSRPQKQIMFKDIVGLQQSKIALSQVIDYMRNPLKFLNIGARMRKGIILYGPPGTGKTTLAKACAGEAGVQFFACNASEFCQIYVGAGPKKVRQLFKKAKEEAPSIIFIDQIDAIGNRKGKSSFDSGADTERNSTINQLLSQMDGFSSHDSVLVIAATNKLQLLDKSLLRPGRFDLKISIALPKLQQRQKIFRHHMQSKNHKLNEAYFYNVAEKMIAWSGADIQNLANESVYQALRRGATLIQQDDVKACLQNRNISGHHG